MTTQHQPTPTRGQLWFSAIKPPMYTVALTPCLVGSFAAYLDTGRLSAATLLTFVFAAVAIIAWLNITNDVFDFDTGIDVHKRESLVNLLGASRRVRNALLLLALLFLAAAFAALSSLPGFSVSRDATGVAVLSLAVFGGYAYQGPPFRLGYYGLGEPICFVTWSLSVVAVYYSQIAAHAPTHDTILREFPAIASRLRLLFLHVLPSLRLSMLPAALFVASPTSLILFTSHFHQESDDLAAGKRSPVVRLGTRGAAALLSYLLGLFALIHVAVLLFSALPAPVALLPLAATSHALELRNFVAANYKVPALVRPAKYYAVKLAFVHGLLCTLAFFVSRSTIPASIDLFHNFLQQATLPSSNVGISSNL